MGPRIKIHSFYAATSLLERIPLRCRIARRTSLKSLSLSHGNTASSTTPVNPGREHEPPRARRLMWLSDHGFIGALAWYPLFQHPANLGLNLSGLVNRLCVFRCRILVRYLTVYVSPPMETLCSETCAYGTYNIRSGIATQACCTSTFNDWK